jgi:hypothetical protein
VATGVAGAPYIRRSRPPIGPRTRLRSIFSLCRQGFGRTRSPSDQAGLQGCTNPAIGLPGSRPHHC